MTPDFLREITVADVGKATFRARGITYRTVDWIGQVLPSDVGKRVYLVGDVLQVENDQQRAERLSRIVNRSAPHYCRPFNAGLDSETGAVCRRLGRLLTALDTEITGHVVDGKILDHVHTFRRELLESLESEGWSCSYDGGNRMKVRPPEHKRPFRRQIAEVAS